MTSTTVARRAARLRRPHLHLALPGRRIRGFEDALDQLAAIDHRAANDLLLKARRDAL
jgi:hypothetical protein